MSCDRLKTSKDISFSNIVSKNKSKKNVHALYLKLISRMIKVNGKFLLVGGNAAAGEEFSTTIFEYDGSQWVTEETGLEIGRTAFVAAEVPNQGVLQC